jgi:predicted AAA+ superfamily ATPase
MKLSDIQAIGATQKTALEKQEQGLERHALPGLPDIQSHALVICGIRRCGKSTLCRQFVRKLKRPYYYLNFDDMRLVSFSHTDFQLLDKVIADSGAQLIFFDEIQSAERWELYVRQKLDEGFQLVITGSNASLLSRELGSRLTGRHLSMEIFPFSYMEFCSFTGANAGPESLSDYLEKGGFPEYLKTGNTNILTQLQLDILYRDIAVRYGIRDAAPLQRLFVYFLSNPAQLFSPSKLTGVAGVKSPTTVLEYISFFEASCLISILPRFAWSVKSQNLAPKKVYIADNGLIKTGAVSFSGNLGALLENCAYNFLRAKFSSSDLPSDSGIYYFTFNNCECDFIFSPRYNPSCIQVCWELTLDNQDREINGLLEAMDFFDLDDGTILTYNAEDMIYTNGKKINVIPLWKYIVQENHYGKRGNLKKNIR